MALKEAEDEAAVNGADERRPRREQIKTFHVVRDAEETWITGRVKELSAIQ